MNTYTKVTAKGLKHEAHIVFETDGTPHVRTHDDADAYFCVGYLHAKYRLFQLDFMRRQGAGRLSEVVGPAMLETDKFQREINLVRLAEGEWKLVQQEASTKAALESYSAGVNAVIAEYRKSGDWPVFFKQLGYTPEDWTPQDSLVCNAVMSQLLSTTEVPIVYSMFEKSLGYDKLMKLFPLLPPNEQHPYDHGPYRKLPPHAFPISPEQYFRGFQTEPHTLAADEAAAAAEPVSDTEASLELLNRFNELSDNSIKRNRNSNAWAVSGEKTVSGAPMVASDPHLILTLPAIWYQVHLEAPGFEINGVTVPGIPFHFIGRNTHCSWGVTAGENASNFFYKEHTDAAHPNQYYWRGAWRDYYTTTTEIKVKGQDPVQHTYLSSVHGPIVTKQDVKYAFNWIYGVPSRGIVGLHNIVKAKNFEQFKATISVWEHSPLNFVCADHDNNIGIIGVGRFAIFKDGVKPWLPMSGTGEADIIGIVQKEAMPHTKNPQEHFVSTSNQRQVGPDYPYYVGTATYFDPGYRANRVYEILNSKRKIDVKDFADMQYDVQDYLAHKMVPVLAKNIATDKSLTALEKKALETLTHWNSKMLTSEVGATIWWSFWEHYMHETFDPWWNLAGVPIKEFNTDPTDYMNSALDEVLETWTLTDPNNEFFTIPQTGQKRNATQVMLAAFKKTVASLTEKLGQDIATWTWGSVHSRVIASITGEPSLNYGPRACDGDSFTLNVAPGMLATWGGSWRMISVLDGKFHGQGIYPGGQSEDPTSPWYLDRLEPWWTGKYAPFVSYHEAEKDPHNKQRWELEPVKH